MLKQLFEKADALKAELASYRPLTPCEVQRLREDFVVEHTYNTNAIEGSSLTLRETAFVLMDNMTIAGKPLSHHLDAVGHKDAFEYMITLTEANEPITERAIKNIHSLVLTQSPQHRGVYRALPVVIRGAAHTPPQPYLIAPQMETLLADYAREISEHKRHPIEIIAEFHLRFEGIHPFIDGNGRTGRLLINLELIKHGYLPVDIKFTDRDKYYSSFDSYFGEAKSPDTLTKMLLDYEIAELERYIQIVKYVNEVRED